MLCLDSFRLRDVMFGYFPAFICYVWIPLGSEMLCLDIFRLLDVMYKQLCL